MLDFLGPLGRGLGRHPTCSEIQQCARQVLREACWCKLTGPKQSFVHFGHDYDMYLGSEQDVPKEALQHQGLFIEPFRSPHHSSES